MLANLLTVNYDTTKRLFDQLIDQLIINKLHFHSIYYFVFIISYCHTSSVAVLLSSSSFYFARNKIVPGC